MSRDPSSAPGVSITWHTVARSLTRPYPVSWPMILLVALVPAYLLIARRAEAGPVHAPEMALDRWWPVVPAWALVYGALYMVLIVAPVLLVQQPELIRRTVWAYLSVWLAAYVGFLVFPTVASRPETVSGEGFAAWGLRSLYGADPPYNCFPSLHVAHSFVSALACRRVHRAVGSIALGCAALVAMSTLFTKQHYVADVVGGVLLAAGAHAVFLRGYSRARVPELERRLAPALALCAAGIAGLGFVACWVVYRWSGF